MVFILLLLGLVGCNILPSREALSGAAAGVSIAGVASEIQEVFTPEYPLYVSPIEICSVSDNIVNCTLFPCKKDCNISTPFEVWVVDNPFVVTVRSSRITTIIEYCSANKEACIELMGKYEGSKIVIQKED